MFRSPFQPNEPDDLDNAIAKLYSRMDSVDPESPEYRKCLVNLTRLHEMKNSNSSSRRPSPDAILAAIASVGGILVIVAYEHSHVLTSKGLGFILKAKT